MLSQSVSTAADVDVVGSVAVGILVDAFIFAVDIPSFYSLMTSAAV